MKSMSLQAKWRFVKLILYRLTLMYMIWNLYMYMLWVIARFKVCLRWFLWVKTRTKMRSEQRGCYLLMSSATLLKMSYSNLILYSKKRILVQVIRPRILTGDGSFPESSFSSRVICIFLCESANASATRFHKIKDFVYKVLINLSSIG
jgi:hypothetical protein